MSQYASWTDEQVLQAYEESLVGAWVDAPGTEQEKNRALVNAVLDDVVEKISIENVLKGIGLQFVKTVDPLDYQLSVATVKEASELRGVKAIIFKSPCIVLNKPTNKLVIDSKICTGCKKCIRELGCPALIPDINGKVKIDPSLCTGCLLCSQICPFEAMFKNYSN